MKCYFKPKIFSNFTFSFLLFSRDKSAEEATKDVIENQLPQIANLVAKGTLQVSVIYGKKLQGMAIKFKVEQQRINDDFVGFFFQIEA